jgi:hypothetical protein
MHQKKRHRFFSTSEDRILSAWFGTPAAATGFEVGRFARISGPMPARRLDTAVAEIVLNRLPQRVPSRIARQREEHPANRLHLPNPDSLDGQARLLFVVSWVDGDARVDQTGSYRLCWVPFYERYIVTESLQKQDDEPGHSALGHFPATSDVIGACREIILAHWAAQLETGARPPIGDVRRAGLVQKNTVACWAELIWGRSPLHNSRDAAIDELLEARNECSVMGFHRP